MLHNCAIALGSNLGDSRSMLSGAIDRLQASAQIELIAVSSWYHTAPIGPPQPDYLNGCVTLQTSLTPWELLNTLHAIEAEFGRVRQEIWGARTLDLDLLLYEQQIVDTPALQLPHPRMTERAFVLVPLTEIAANWLEPKSGQSIASLCNKLEYSDVGRLQQTIIHNSMPLGNEPAKIIKKKLNYQGRKFSFNVNEIQLPNGVTGEWECIHHPGGALAVPITPDGKLVLVKQYRFATQGRILEFPAGTLELGESPATTIKRELEEETGYRAHNWKDLGDFFLAPGYCDEIIYAFLAQDLEKLAVQPAVDADEDIEVVLMSPAEFEAAIYANEPIDAKSIAAYFLARIYF
jgi:ADP-ribose pyrophosphatase